MRSAQAASADLSPLWTERATLSLRKGYRSLIAASPALTTAKVTRSDLFIYKAGNAIRTRDIHLGKVTLYH